MNQRNNNLTVKQRLLKQKKPQWAINLINEYIDVKEDEVSEMADKLRDEVTSIHKEYSAKMYSKIEETIEKFKDDLIDWRNGNYLETDDFDDD